MKKPYEKNIVKSRRNARNLNAIEFEEIALDILCVDSGPELLT